MIIDSTTVQARWERMRSALDTAGIDALLVADRLNFAYLTGYQSREFAKRFRHLLFLLDRDGHAHALAPSNEAAALCSMPGLKVQVYRAEPLDMATAAAFVSAACGAGCKRIGIELSGADRPCLTAGAMDALRDCLSALQLQDASAILARARLIKAPEEIASIRAAGTMAQAAWQAMLPELRPGVSTAKVAAFLAAAIAEQGADYNFPGHLEVRNASDPTSTAVREGQVLWCDFGLTVAGYHSDISRRAVLGQPQRAQLENHANGLLLLHEMIRSLKTGRAIDKAMRSMLAMRRRFHYGGDRPQRFGHGIGLCGAEPPSLAETEDATIEAGMVLTPEPSFSAMDGEFVHLEEMVAIGTEGAELLTLGAGTLYQVGQA